MKRKHERDEPNSYVDGEIYTTIKTTSEFRNVSVTVQECVSDGGRGRRAGVARKADLKWKLQITTSAASTGGVD